MRSVPSSTDRVSEPVSHKVASQHRGEGARALVMGARDIISSRDDVVISAHDAGSLSKLVSESTPAAERKVDPTSNSNGHSISAEELEPTGDATRSKGADDVDKSGNSSPAVISWDGDPDISIGDDIGAAQLVRMEHEFLTLG